MDKILGKNIYDREIPKNGELFYKLFGSKDGCEIVQISSSDTPDSEVYIQQEDEWVVLLQGSAKLLIDDNEIELHKGDTLYIPAKTPHKVLSTTKGALWLAVHMHKGIK